MTTTSPHLRQSRAIFQDVNPFAPSTSAPTVHNNNTTTRSTRSPSSCSTASFRSASSQPPTSSLAEMLAQSFSTNINNMNFFARSGSFAARNGSSSSVGNSSAGSSRRPSCFSIMEMEEEKAEFGEGVVGVLEPRPGLGWWGVREVLEEEGASRRGSLS